MLMEIAAAVRSLGSFIVAVMASERIDKASLLGRESTAHAVSSYRRSRSAGQAHLLCHARCDCVGGRRLHGFLKIGVVAACLHGSATRSRDPWWTIFIVAATVASIALTHGDVFKRKARV